ncbi:MAG: PQQ-binding-like beta-propeller repeat protein [Cyclobacteriaceae bacterium]|nr:PQQ-binding-like beta-propeller repeat protein [Cyclobacteriaceae bacterium]
MKFPAILFLILFILSACKKSKINTSNVHQLQVAWVYHTNDADTVNKSQIQCNPIIIDSVLYGTTPQLVVFALDASTGKELWRFDPKSEQFKDFPATRFIMNNNRGVTFWQEGDDKRILMIAGNFLYAIRASDGSRISSFGKNGVIDLKKGLDRNVDELYVTSTSPGIIYKNLFIIGSRVSEGSDAAPGHIRAYDVKTGEQVWIFHTIPHPGEFGYSTWEDSLAYQRIGGANAWAGFSLDEERGIVYVPTGSAAFDFYGGKRKGSNLFANSVLALNAATGKRIWHFQTIHHDIWDFDLPTAPALVTLKKGWRTIDAVAQPTKTGFVFLFDRETGEPIYPIEEVAVSTGTDLKGEKLWPTQPKPTLPEPFMRQTMTEEDLNDLVPDSSYQELRSRFKQFRSGGMFIPQSTQGIIMFPGLDGGAEWGGPAFDPETGLLYINSNEMPWAITMKEVDLSNAAAENYGIAGKRLYNQNCLACHGPDLKGSGNNPGITNASEKYTSKTLIDLIRSGRRMMPAITHLKQEELDAIGAYVMNDEMKFKERFPLKPAEIDSFRYLPYTITGYNKFLTREGYAGIKPPWGTLNAIDLNSGKLVWKIPLGEYPEFKEKGIITGTENYGGPAVTAGGLVFIGATRDDKFRVFDKTNGKLLWETTLPASAFATPAVYEVNGKQFVRGCLCGFFNCRLSKGNGQ